MEKLVEYQKQKMAPRKERVPGADEVEAGVDSRGVRSLEDLQNAAVGTVITLRVVSVNDGGDMVKSVQIVVRSPGELDEDDFIKLENRLKDELARVGRWAEEEVDGGKIRPWILSPRQREALELARDGLVNKEIAERMGIGEQTVKNMLVHSLRKLEAKNRVHAVIQAIRRREIEL